MNKKRKRKRKKPSNGNDPIKEGGIQETEKQDGEF